MPATSMETVCPDLVVVRRDRSDKTASVRVLLQKWQPRDVIVRVWDEHAEEPRETVFYGPFPSDNPSPSTCTYPSRCLRQGMTAAREHWIHRNEAPAAIRRTAYEFDDARSDQRGRGFLGFGKVRVVDLDSFAETITTFDHATLDDGRYPYANVPADVWRITPILANWHGPRRAASCCPMGSGIHHRARQPHAPHLRAPFHEQRLDLRGVFRPPPARTCGNSTSP